MKNRKLVMLAEKFEEGRHSIAGVFISEKLDGQRALWLPETVGVDIEEIGWANPDAHGRRTVSTGLWSRLGHVIHAPLSFTGVLPRFPLDGELWLGRGRYQELMGITKRLPENALPWRDVKYKVFDSPSYAAIYEEGRVYETLYKTTFMGKIPNLRDCYDLGGGNFEKTYYYLKHQWPQLDLHEQVLSPFRTDDARVMVEEWMSKLKSSGGEGLMIRIPSSIWTPRRCHSIVKMKHWEDDEATVVGFTMGKGRHNGALGALIVEWKGRRFELSGMTDIQRKLSPSVNSNNILRIDPKHFPNGTVVTFRYRELTLAGVPKEARFLRIKVSE